MRSRSDLRSFESILIIMSMFLPSLILIQWNVQINAGSNEISNEINSDITLEYDIYYASPKPGTTALEYYPKVAMGSQNPRTAIKTASIPIDTDYCIIWVQFTDVSATKTLTEINTTLFGVTNSLKSYMLENSYGSYTIGGQIVGAKVYTSAYSMAYYGDDGTNGQIDRLNGHPNRLALESLDLAINDVNYANFDKNGDGIVDHLIIIHAGYGQEEDPQSTSRIWSHYSGLYTSKDGVTFKDYIMVSEHSPMGVIAHECGHDLGLIDLYDIDYSSDGIGVWGIMAAGGWLSSPSHFCAYNKIQLGWMTPQTITNVINTQISIRQRNLYPDVVQVKISDKEYYLLENIYRQGSQYDLSLPGNGLLITHIDESRTSNDLDTRRLVDVVEADGNNELDTYGSPVGEAGDLWKSNQIGFTDETYPSARAYDGSNSGWKIHNIGAAGSIILLDVSKSISDDIQINQVQIPRFLSLGTYNATNNTYNPVNITFQAKFQQKGGVNNTDISIVMELYEDQISESTRKNQITQIYPQILAGIEYTYNWTISIANPAQYIVRTFLQHDQDQNLENNEVFEAFQVGPTIGGLDWDFESALNTEKAKWNFNYQRYNLLGFYTTNPLSSYQWNLVNNNSVSEANPISMATPINAWHFGFIKENSTWGIESWLKLSNYNATMTLASPLAIPNTTSTYLSLFTKYIMDETTDEKSSSQTKPSTASTAPPNKNRILLQGSSDGSVWQTIHTYYGIQTDWEQIFFNLTGYAGQNIWLRIRIELIESVANGYFMFDSLRLSSLPPISEIFPKIVTPSFDSLQPNTFIIPPNYSIQLPLKITNLGSYKTKILISGVINQSKETPIASHLIPFNQTVLMPYSMSHIIIKINTTLTAQKGDKFYLTINMTQQILINNIDTVINSQLVQYTFEIVTQKEFEDSNTTDSSDGIDSIFEEYWIYIIIGSLIGVAGITIIWIRKRRIDAN